MVSLTFLLCDVEVVVCDKYKTDNVFTIDEDSCLKKGLATYGFHVDSRLNEYEKASQWLIGISHGFNCTNRIFFL